MEGRLHAKKTQLDSSSRFDTIPGCDGQATRTHTAVAQRCAVKISGLNKIRTAIPNMPMLHCGLIVHTQFMHMSSKKNDIKETCGQLLPDVNTTGRKFNSNATDYTQTDHSSIM